MKCFLGGTCNNSIWREKLIPLLKIDYFNPVVEDWTPAHQAREIIERKNCDFCLYVITPRMKGVYSIAEASVDTCVKKNTIFCVLEEDGGLTWDVSQKKSLDAVSKLLKENGAICLNSLNEIAKFLNKMK